VRISGVAACLRAEQPAGGRGAQGLLPSRICIAGLRRVVGAAVLQLDSVGTHDDDEVDAEGDGEEGADEVADGEGGDHDYDQVDHLQDGDH